MRAASCFRSTTLLHAETILPRDVRLNDDNSKERFLADVLPYRWDAATTNVVPNPQRSHVRSILRNGIRDAVTEARSGGVQGHRFAGLWMPFRRAAGLFAAQPNLLPTFLDVALLQRDHSVATPRAHENHESQLRPPAAACGCWSHRESLDLVYADLSDSAAELVLALAALDGTPDVTHLESPRNVLLPGARRILLALSTHRFDAFADRYFSPRNELRPRPAIVLRSAPLPTRQLHASRIPPEGSVRASVAAEPVGPRLCGREFWEAVATRTLVDRVATLFASGRAS